jgi:hypothetical protein
VLTFYFASIISVRSTHLRERIRNRIRIRASDYLIRIRKAQKHADPDPQHGFARYLNRETIFNIFEKQFVMYTIQYKGTFLYLHEEPSLVCRFACILAYVYYIFFLVLVDQIFSFAKTSCASSLAKSHADYLTGLSGASCAAFLKAYFRLVGK